MQENVKIGTVLIEKGLVTEKQLAEALQRQKNTSEKIGEILVSLGFITEKNFLEAFAELLRIEYVDLDNYDFDKAVSALLPESQARLFRAILLKEVQGHYLVGVVDPQDLFAIDELTRILDRPIKLALVFEKSLLKALDLLYRRTEEIYGFAEELESELSRGGKGKDKKDDKKREVETAVAHLIHSLFADAVQVNASDIHIEPDEKVLRLRQRVDGQLQEQIIEGGKGIAAALSQRLKLMAGLNIAEKRLPQDGRFNIKVRGMPIDVRLSTMPIQFGESIVMRLLNQATGILDLELLGMPAKMLEDFRRLIKLPKGLILVTGPTGSGKTTTLYAALNEMNDIAKKFITIEDPVEYRLSRINQVQVRSNLGLTFARVLRSSLRQDPDIILVGEIRDLETASIALRAALTGHLVLATLHTNDAASTAMRLLDMGVEGYLVAATVKAALAQRLVRRICESCKEKYQPNEEEKSFFRQFYGEMFDKCEFYHGGGCEHCNGSGYSGRVGVYELLEFDSAMKDLLRRNDAAEFSVLAEKGQKDRSLLAGSFDLACQGVTTLSEALRVAGEQE